MLSKEDAKNLFSRMYGTRKVESIITHGNLYILLAPDSDPVEGNMDPFFSVDIKTGEINEFSIFIDGNAIEISNKFKEEQRSKNAK